MGNDDWIEPFCKNEKERTIFNGLVKERYEIQKRIDKIIDDFNRKHKNIECSLYFYQKDKISPKASICLKTTAKTLASTYIMGQTIQL